MTNSYSIQAVNHNNNNEFIVVDKDGINMTGEYHSYADAVRIRDQYIAQQKPEIKDYNITVGICAKVSTAKISDLQDRIESALDLALLGWADVEDCVVRADEVQEDQFAHLSQADRNKRFACVWFDQYEEKTEINDITWFTTDNGYSLVDIMNVACMNMGDTYNVDLRGNKVIRIR